MHFGELSKERLVVQPGQSNAMISPSMNVKKRSSFGFFVVFSARSSQFLKYFPAFAPPFDTCLPEFARSSAPSHDGPTMEKMTGGTPEVRSDKILTLMTFNIRHSNNGPMHYGAAVKWV